MWFKYCIDDIMQALLINYDNIVLIMFSNKGYLS